MRKIGLALGGGSARGLAHIGLLQVIEEEKIPVHRVVGTRYLSKTSSSLLQRSPATGKRARKSCSAKGMLPGL